jgi:hypothetical protein
MLPALLLTAAALAIPATASAAIYNVNTADSGAGSLRDAMTQVNTSPDPAGDTINVPAGTITLASALPALDNAATKLTIAGAGARATTINGADTYRIFEIHDGTITLAGLTITHGHTDGGAGLFLGGGTVTVNDSALTNNVSTTSQGGAVWVDGASAELTMNRDFVDSNSAVSYGAGLDVDNGHATVNTTTFSRNTADSEPAIDIDTANGVTANGLTVVDNTSGSNAGAICCGTPDQGTFTNSLIVRNHVQGSTTPAGCESPQVSGGHNITDDESCFGPASGTDRVVADAGLAPSPANNGGPTDTYALLPGSPAIDTGDSTPMACPSPDQRGVPRPIGSACDVGAYEFAPPAATTGDAGTPTTTTESVSGSAIPYAGASYHFDYGTTTAYGSSTASTPLADGNSAIPVTANLTGLAPGTTYHYRLVVTNTDGTTTGADKTFTTASAPTVTTGGASNVKQNSVTLSGTVDAHGQPATFTFQYGTAAAYGSQTVSAGVPAGTGPVTVTRTITGLKAGQGYHYRLVATNATGTANGSDATFKTKGRVAPRRVSVKAKPTHDATFPYRYTFTGKLTIPSGISKSLACRGKVSVQIKNGKKTISNRRVKVSKSCSYRETVTFKVRRRVPGSGRLKATARFAGNATLKPKSSKRLYVRFG